MANRFINDDVKLRHGGRKAPRISQYDLAKMIINIAKKIDDEEFDYQVEQYNCAGDLQKELGIAASIIVNNEDDDTFESDNKFGFEWSNFYIECYGKNLNPKNMCGLQTLSNGFTFLGFHTAGDEQISAFGIMYYDGKRLRLYFPSYGNYVNLDFGCAIGSEDYYGAKRNAAEKKYRSLGIWDENNPELFEYGSPNLAAMYCAKYGVKTYDANINQLNWDAIKHDIQSRIEVI